MNQTNNTKPLTLKDLWYIFVQRIIIIALVAIITTVCSYGIARSQYKPQYASVATLYILRSNEYQNSSSNEISDELSLALKVVADCTYILKSRTVINHVIDELDLNTNYSQLYKKISTNTPHNTRILEQLSVDRVHVLLNGRIVEEGGSELIEKIDREGFGFLKQD